MKQYTHPLSAPPPLPPPSSLLLIDWPEHATPLRQHALDWKHSCCTQRRSLVLVRAGKQIICCCQIFVFLVPQLPIICLLHTPARSLVPLSIPPTTHNPRIRPCSKTPVSRITRQLSGTFRRSRPASRLCKRSEAHSGKHFQQFHHNKEYSPAQKSAGTSHNHRWSIDHCTPHAHVHKHDRFKSMPIPKAHHAMLAACLLACLLVCQPACTCISNRGLQ